MRIIVTGSKGQLGTELLGLLEGSHHDVLGLHRGVVDLTDRALVVAALSEFQPDLIIHGAAYTAVDLAESEVERAYLVNALATRFVGEGARLVGAHVVYVSTDYVFDGTKVGPYLEWDPTNPQSVYGRSKLAGEHEIDPNWTIARTSWVVGTHGNNMLKTVLRLAQERDTLSFVDDQVGQPSFTADLAPALLQLGVARVPGVFHLSNTGRVSWFEFVQEIFRAAGHDPARVSPISTADLQPPRPAPRPANSVLDNFAWRGSGFSPLPDFRQALARAVEGLSA